SSSSSGGSGSPSVVIVLGECADYRQVMAYAAARGLKSPDRAWLILGGARDPACHVSAAACGRDDGRDALALSAMSGALSMDWSPMPTSRSNAAAYASAAAALGLERFVSEFSPPPAGGDAYPAVPFATPPSLGLPLPSCVGGGRHPALRPPMPT
ncbi:unnamed protein product, partial [Scytosiphon promiscuus]